MAVTFAIAVAVHARAGDVVSVFFPAATVRFSGLRSALMKSHGTAEKSPFLYNETAAAWFMTDECAIGPGGRLSGQATRYTQAPNPDVAVARIVRGHVLQTAVVQDTAFGHPDTLVTVEVFEDVEIAPGEAWFPGPPRR